MKSLMLTLRYLSRRLRTVPNGITLIRPLGTIGFVLLNQPTASPDSLWTRWGLWFIFLAMVSSDLVDGWLARRLQQMSKLGHILDHLCDVLFILAALSTFVGRGLVPWWLPAAIAWAFLLYVVNVWWWPTAQPARRLLGGQLGHIGGMLYYATTGLVTLHVCTQARWFSPLFLWGWCLSTALVAAVSGSEHLIQVWCRAVRACRAAPRAENTPRSGH
jgi:phosphatidylglycerophosphate synthase